MELICLIFQVPSKLPAAGFWGENPTNLEDNPIKVKQIEFPLISIEDLSACLILSDSDQWGFSALNCGWIVPQIIVFMWNLGPQ